MLNLEHGTRAVAHGPTQCRDHVNAAAACIEEILAVTGCFAQAKKQFQF